MDLHQFGFSIWICTSMVVYITSETQLSANSDGYLPETYEIIHYGADILKSIVFHHEDDDKFLRMMRRIAIENPKIQSLMNSSSSPFSEMNLCLQRDGLDHLNSFFKYINKEYEKFEEFYGKRDGSRGEFAHDIEEMYRTGILDIHLRQGLTWANMTHPQHNRGLFEALVDDYNLQVRGNCHNFKSLDQYINNLCNIILLGIVKVYSMIMYSIVKINHDRSLPVINTIIEDFHMHILRVTDDALAVVTSSKQIYRDDPPVHQKGITYESLDYFLQGYVTDQKYLRHDGSCTVMCSVYDDVIHYDHADAHLFPRNSICRGRIRSCTKTVVNRMCLAPLDSTKRYMSLSRITPVWRQMKYWGGQTNGSACSIASNIWFSLPHCRICKCTCDIESPNSIRYVDLQPRSTRSDSLYVQFMFRSTFDKSVYSPALSDSIITGIRFRIINRVLYIQIQEGELVNGRVITETVAWKEIDNTDRNHEHDYLLFKLDYDNRLFDLTDLTLPKNYAIDTVGFMDVKNVVSLQIRGRLINDEEINDLPYHDLFNQSARTLRSRPEFKPDGFDVPTKEDIRNDRISEANEYLLKFETSDWINDASQNVVPFIDLQDVVTYPPTPISGIGMHLRYGGSSGGFLAPKIILTNDVIDVMHAKIKDVITSLREDIIKEAEIVARRMHLEKVIHRMETSYRPEVQQLIKLIKSDPFSISRG